MMSGKPLPITKRMVWKAYQSVKGNGEAAGVDGQSLDDFAQDLENNLDKLWNRMASGSYMPPAVRRVEIPKVKGSVRPLGIATVADRVAQMVVKQHLEPELDKLFDSDSYGYRPGKSAHQAIERTRTRCWDYDWVLDLDIQAFFDSKFLAHELSHIELHQRIGLWRGLGGAIPAWFDEGLAAVISRDSRYVAVRPDGEPACLAEPNGALPTDRRAWGEAAGKKDRPLYAMAACSVIRWMRENGGRPGVLDAIDRVADGDVFAPSRAGD